MRTLQTLVLAAAAAVAVAGPAGAQDLARGQQVFQRWCSYCHAAVSGTERLAGTSALALKYGKDKPAVLEQRTDLTADQVKYFVRHGVNAMPFARKTEINDADLEAVAAYVSRNTPK